MPPPKDQKQGESKGAPERRTTGQIPLPSTSKSTNGLPRTTTGEVKLSGKSTNGLPQVGPRTSTGELNLASKSTNGLPQVPARTATGELRAQSGKSTNGLSPVSSSKDGLPQVGAKPTRTTTGEVRIPEEGATSGAHPMPGVAPVTLDPNQVNRKRLTEVQQLQNSDAFASWGQQRRRANYIATPTDPGTLKAQQEEEPWIDPDYNPDGASPLPECIGRETWRALKAPFTSKEGKRTKELYEQVANQFAIGNNDRYDEDGPGKPRGHIYVWDVSRAMNCEIPHFAGARELSIAQTVDWVKHEGPMRGWLKVAELEAAAIASKGMMVVVVPREVKTRQIAIVLPHDAKGGLLVTGAGLVIGRDVPVRELLGTGVVDCFYHP